MKNKEVEEVIKEAQTIIKQENEKVSNETTKFTIMGFTITKLLSYFVIYSVIGYIIETLFGLVTKGVIESRKSFLYGPFCGIYGLGAIAMLVGLQKFKKNNYTIFIGGFFIGSIVEYVISLVGELLFDIKWWDYSGMAFNINGRICITFSFFWGLLAIYLISHVQPKIDKFLNKIPKHTLKTFAITFVVFMVFDCLITGVALKMFFTRLVNDYNLELQGVGAYLEEYTKLYENEDIKKVVDKFFSNEKMLKTFPNIKVTSQNGDIILVRDILTDINPYYFRIFTPKKKTVIE